MCAYDYAVYVHSHSYVWMWEHKAIHTCLWRSGQSQVSVLGYHLNLCQGLILLFICGICQATWASSSQKFAFLYLSHSCRRARIIGRRATCLAFLCVFWGFELRSSQLHSEHLCLLSHLSSSSSILFKCICQKMWNCILICICKLHYFSAELHQLSLN